ALDVGHDLVEKACRLSRVEERQDVGMVEPGRELDLPQEPLGAQGDREFRSQHLDRDQPFVFRVSSQEYERRPTVAELALDRVPASEGNFQTTSEVGHG